MRQKATGQIPLDGAMAAAGLNSAPGMIHPQIPATGGIMVRCWFCGGQAEYMKCVVRSKREGTWKCPTCNGKIGKLHRQFGSWPPTDIPLDADKLDDEARHKFYSGLSSLEGKAEIRAYALRFLETYRTEEQRALEGGEFLPLSVWRTRGFDTESIKQHTTPDNIREDRVLGKVHRGGTHAHQR